MQSNCSVETVFSSAPSPRNAEVPNVARSDLPRILNVSVLFGSLASFPTATSAVSRALDRAGTRLNTGVAPRTISSSRCPATGSRAALGFSSWTMSPASFSTGCALVSTVVASVSVGGVWSIASPSAERLSAANVVAPSFSSEVTVGATGASAPVVAASPSMNCASRVSRVGEQPEQVLRRADQLVGVGDRVVELDAAAGHRVGEIGQRAAQPGLGLAARRSRTPCRGRRTGCCGSSPRWWRSSACRRRPRRAWRRRGTARRTCRRAPRRGGPGIWCRRAAARGSSGARARARAYGCGYCRFAGSGVIVST